MKILLLSCSTGEGHNHCALAVKEALDARGHETSFLDMLHMFGDPGPLSFDKILNRISTKAPDVFGMMYHAGVMYSATGVTSPVYMANIRHARQLNAFIRDNGYDAVVCSHLFPMETLTFLRRWERCDVKCYGILSDYTCIPFLAETNLDAYFLPHSEVRELCIQAGMPVEKLIVSGMPVAARFLAPMDKAAARAALGLPADKKIYLIMTGGIGCGDAVSLCDAIRRVPDENALLCVLPGRNEALRQALEDAYHGQGVLTVPFTDQVPVYMHVADVLLSKAGGISSSEAAMLGVPLVHTMAIPGVETENAAFFARHGLSFFARSVDEAARFADRLIYDPVCAERMLAAQSACLPRDGAESRSQPPSQHNKEQKPAPCAGGNSRAGRWFYRYGSSPARASRPAARQRPPAARRQTPRAHSPETGRTPPPAADGAHDGCPARAGSIPFLRTNTTRAPPCKAASAAGSGSRNQTRARHRAGPSAPRSCRRPPLPPDRSAAPETPGG